MTTPAFDPDAAAAEGSGVFGLPFTREQSRVVLVPVPFDATTSYRRGTASGPAAILEASRQVDLYDRRFGRVYERGIHMLEPDPRVRRLNMAARRLADPVIAAGGVGLTKVQSKGLAKVDAMCEELNQIVHDQVAALLAEGRVPGVIGGEHSAPFGAIRACAERHGPIGILHLDAHMDLRDAFEGFTWSHASIMHNVVKRIDAVERIVQVGIRDFGEREMQLAESQGERVKVYYDDAIADTIDGGTAWGTLCREIVGRLPEHVYVSFDIDAFDPALCPHTGTPVPGGLTFHQVGILLETLRRSGKVVVGFDLVEVAPGGAKDPEWDANVGARVLYKLCGLT